MFPCLRSHNSPKYGTRNKSRVIFEIPRSSSFWWALKFFIFDHRALRKLGLKRVTPYLKLDQINLSSKWPKLAVNGPNLPPKWPQQGSLRTAYLWTVPLFMIWINSGHFGPEIGGKPPKKTRPEERLFQSCFSYGVTHLKPNFLSPPWAKMKIFSANQKAEDLRISKLTLL